MTETPVIERKNEESLKFNLQFLQPYEKELISFFKYATKISGDKFPKSTSADGSGKMRTLTSGKQIPEKGYSIQDTKFPELFAKFSETELFTFLFETYFTSLGKTKYEVISVFTNSILGNEDEVSRVLTSEQAVSFLNILIQIQKELGAELQPNFIGIDEGIQIKSSDLISNMLFLRTSMVLNSI